MLSSFNAEIKLEFNVCQQRQSRLSDNDCHHPRPRMTWRPSLTNAESNISPYLQTQTSESPDDNLSNPIPPSLYLTITPHTMMNRITSLPRPASILRTAKSTRAFSTPTAPLSAVRSSGANVAFEFDVKNVGREIRKRGLTSSVASGSGMDRVSAIGF